ncbi:VCBS domain-containing protein, partial [Ramlibacter solisilvae]
TDSNGATATRTITINLTGANDTAEIGGVTSGAATEDTSLVVGNLTAGGLLSITDVDQGQASFTAQASTIGANGYGTFTLATDGTWTYTANNSQAAVQSLGAGQLLTDSFTAVSKDGSASETVTVTINGANDTAVIGGGATGSITEDIAVTAGNLATSGSLTVNDVDQGQSSFTAQVGTTGSNGYGIFTLAANGTWTYTANNSQAAIQNLGAGQSLTDSFTAVSKDGSASQTITVTINGANETVPGISVVGTGRADSLVGTIGDDVIDGRLGADTMAGGRGNDTYYINEAGDVVVENANEGVDTVIAAVNYTLGVNQENLTLGGLGSLSGSGNALSNLIVGNAANNVLNGFGGADTLTGGLGADTFTFSAAADTSVATPDEVTDFNARQGDKIDLRAIDARLDMAGDQAFRFIGTAAFSGNAAGQLRFDAASHTLLGSTDADTDAEFAIVLTGVSSLTTADILL